MLRTVTTSCVNWRSEKKLFFSTIEEQGKLTEELRKRIEQSWDATEVEDIISAL